MWPERDLLAWEREAIGYYATSHPLAKHERRLRVLANARSSELDEIPDRTEVRLGGMIRGLRTSIVRKGRNEGRRMGFFQLEDFSGMVECVVFARTFADLGHLLEPDAIVVLDGRVSRDRDTPSVHVNRVVPIDEASRVMAQGVLVRLSAVEGDVLARLKVAVAEATGSLPLVLEFHPEPETVARVKAGPAWGVEASEQLLANLDALPEVEAAEFLAKSP
jgi:DNA polymerase-3 subunit alpha